MAGSAFSGTGKVWMNGKIVDWADANDPRRVARHPLRIGACSKARAATRRRRARRSSASTRTCAGSTTRRASTAWTTRSIATTLTQAVDRHRAGQRPRRLLHPAADLSRLPHARRQSAALPGGRRDSRVGMGRLPRPGRARAGRGRARELVDAQRAEHVSGDGQVGRQLRQLQPHQDGSRRSTATAKASRSIRTATSAKAAARTCSSCATRCSTRRRSPRRCCRASRATAIMTLAQDLGLTVQRAGPAARDALHRRRGVLRRHGRRDHADPVGRQDPDRRRRARARSRRRCSSAFFDYINGVVPDRHGWLPPVDIPAARAVPAAATRTH